MLFRCNVNCFMYYMTTVAASTHARNLISTVSRFYVYHSLVVHAPGVIVCRLLALFILLCIAHAHAQLQLFVYLSRVPQQGQRQFLWLPCRIYTRLSNIHFISLPPSLFCACVLCFTVYSLFLRGNCPFGFPVQVQQVC